MINYLDLDILSVKSAAVIAHGCNTIGKMGRGLALDIRNKYPHVYYDYKAHCSQFGSLLLGDVSMYEVDEESELWIANLYTQTEISRTKRVAQVNAIRKSLDQLLELMTTDYRFLYHQLFIPYIGCSNGGLDWIEDVEPIIISLDKEYNGKVIINVCQPPQK